MTRVWPWIHAAAILACLWLVLVMVFGAGVR